jgi:hypothetical protein
MIRRASSSRVGFDGGSFPGRGSSSGFTARTVVPNRKELLSQINGHDHALITVPCGAQNTALEMRPNSKGANAKNQKGPLVIMGNRKGQYPAVGTGRIRPLAKSKQATNEKAPPGGRVRTGQAG